MGGLIAGAAFAQLGPLNPPAGPVSDTAPSLAEIQAEVALLRGIIEDDGQQQDFDVFAVGGGGTAAATYTGSGRIVKIIYQGLDDNADVGAGTVRIDGSARREFRFNTGIQFTGELEFKEQQFDTFGVRFASNFNISVVGGAHIAVIFVPD